MARSGDRLLDCGAVTLPRRAPWGAALILAVAGLGVLYADPLRTGFLNDDFLFIEEAVTRPLTSSLTGVGALGNFFRPLSRQVYFAALTPIAGGVPWVFHAVNALIFAGVVLLLVDLLRALLPLNGVMAGALYFATLPLQRVNLIWISCGQDLLALLFALAALACFRRGRDRWACVATVAALASKEVALPLPAALAAWAWWCGAPDANGVRVRPTPLDLSRRIAPFAVIVIVWLAVILAQRARHPVTAATLQFAPGHFLAAFAHGIQSLLGLDHPAGLARGLAGNPPALVPLVALAALAWWLPSPAPAGAAVPAAGATPGRTPSDRSILAFAASWSAAFTLPVGPVVQAWSAYYYALAAVGGALVVGLACRRIDRWGWIGLTTVLLWWHAGSSATTSFAVADRPWGWTSHLTAFYFQRGAELSGMLRRGLRDYEPHPAPGTRFFFATLPSWSGFQMGSGALVRTLYRDTSLAGYFYSQFSESTAADRPCRFLMWDGIQFAPLYRRAREPWFQVGSDLLLLDRPAGAAHAFRRGLAAGEGHPDHLYWLGWAELWRGRRPEAEAAWRAFGAHDDSAAYLASLTAARDAFQAQDTLGARRKLFEAVRAGIGLPEAHGALGELLESRQLKYALLELKVAAFLDRRDARARRHLALGLVAMRLDEAARMVFEEVARIDPGWARDSTLARARSTLDRRSGAGTSVVEF